MMFCNLYLVLLLPMFSGSSVCLYNFLESNVACWTTNFSKRIVFFASFFLSSTGVLENILIAVSYLARVDFCGLIQGAA
jgi:hypothetical protein